MQEQARQPQLFGDTICLGVPIAFVASQWMIHVLKVHAYLVRTPGQRRTLQQAVFAVLSRQLDSRFGRLALVADDDMSFATLTMGHE